MPPPAPIRRAALVGALLAIAVFAGLAAGGTPSGLLARGPFSSDFFDEQAHAILDGRLDVDPSVAGLEGFAHEGRTYLYFGLVPSLLRLPIAAVTDSLDGRLTQLSMVLALAVALAATTRLVWRARRWRHGEDLPLRPWEPFAAGAFVAGVGLASPLLFLASRPVVYHEVELWGAATTLVALDALLRWWDEPSRGHLVLASAGALIAFNTRASVGGGAVIVLAAVLGLAVLWRREPWRRLPVLALAVLVPVGVYAAVNFARFDAPFAIPFDDQDLSRFDPARQATLDATDGTLFGPEFAPTALITYLRPDGVDLQRLFPWVTFRDSTTVIGDPAFDTIDRSASLPVVAPGLLVLAAVGGVALARRRDRDPWLAMTVGSAGGLVSTLTIAFIANRYLSDFTPILVLPASIGLWVVADGLAGLGRLPRWCGTAGLAGVSVLAMGVSVALALQAQRLFILPSTEERRGFVGLQYDVDDLLGGGRPPDVRRVDRLGPVAHRGAIELVGDCEALYWSDGRRWWPLELGSPNAWRLEGDLRTGELTLLRGEGWSVIAATRAEVVQVRYQPDSGEAVLGPELRLGTLVERRVEATIDPAGSELVVDVDGEHALRAWLVDLRGPVESAAGWATGDPATPLCDELAARAAAE